MNNVLSIVLLSSTALSCSAQVQKIEDLGNVGPVKKLFGNFKFTEGPAAAPDGSVYFTDIPNEKIHRITVEGKLTAFSDKSRHSNGLMVNAQSVLFACEMDGQLVKYEKGANSRKVVAEMYEGKRFNAPNDLVLDKSGGIYFTDPEYNAPNPWPQVKRCFYYVYPDGKIVRLVDEDFPNPNGIILSPDEKTLYIIPSKSPKMLAYEVLAPGKIGNGKTFCELKQEKANGTSGGDGLTVDVKGNLYITSNLGVQIFSPAGKHLGTISVPEVPANVTFAGNENKMLYITARTSVYTCSMPIAGHQFPGK
ncbi:MAG: SMP-30/gluconolactonase/LRE family protein [Zavarzinella sp.]